VANIKKEDLPAEVVEYIDSLEAHADTLEADLEAATTQVDTLTKERDDLVAKGAVSDIEKGDADLTAILAKADPAVAAIITKQAADLKTATEAIAKAADERTTTTMVAKAAALPMISETPTELGEVLKTAYGVSDEFGTQVEGLLKAANTQIAQGNLFASFGKSGAEVTVSASVDAAAAELRKGDPSLTREQAITKAYEQNPALYAEYMADQKG
jgi:hypothetical protein